MLSEVSLNIALDSRAIGGLLTYLHSIFFQIMTMTAQARTAQVPFS